MRARLGIATDAHADGDVDVEKSVDKKRSDDYVDSAMKKKKSVSSTSYYSHLVDDDEESVGVALFRCRDRRVSPYSSET